MLVLLLLLLLVLFSSLTEKFIEPLVVSLLRRLGRGVVPPDDDDDRSEYSENAANKYVSSVLASSSSVTGLSICDVVPSDFVLLMLFVFEKLTPPGANLR
jgi:hypothetical protein